MGDLDSEPNPEPCAFFKVRGCFVGHLHLFPIKRGGFTLIELLIVLAIIAAFCRGS